MDEDGNLIIPEDTYCQRADAVIRLVIAAEQISSKQSREYLSRMAEKIINSVNLPTADVMEFKALEKYKSETPSN